MSRRKDPATLVIDFFEQAPIDAALTVLNVGKSIVKRRQAAAAKPQTPVGTGLTPAQAAGFSPSSDS